MMLPLMQAASASVITVFILSGLMLINFKVALTAIGGLTAVYPLGSSTSSRPRLRRNGWVITESDEERYQAVQEGLGGIRDVLLDNAQPI